MPTLEGETLDQKMNVDACIPKTNTKPQSWMDVSWREHVTEHLVCVRPLVDSSELDKYN